MKEGVVGARLGVDLASFLRGKFEAELTLLRQRDALLADLLNAPVQTSAPEEFRLRRGTDLAPGRGLESILRRGWSFPEHWGIWSIGAKSVLHLAFDRGTLFPVVAKLDLHAFVPPDSSQTVIITVNNREAATARFERTHPERTQSVEIQAEDLSADFLVTITFVISNPTCPADVAPSSDRRKLGLALRRLRIC